MLSQELRHFFLISLIHFSSCDRRIINGKETQKRYMVYLIQSKSATRNYDAWMCGGAIITPEYILTSAACVEDVQGVYVIAGYDKYVKAKDIDRNKCTRAFKRRIVLACVPEAYDLVYNKVEKWSTLDIAIVKVERPYRFSDSRFPEHCSYIPDKISVNFDIKKEENNMNAIVLGWGHNNRWRKLDDKSDYNLEELTYSSTTIYSKEECKKYFQKPDFSNLIDKYMICTSGISPINDKGEIVVQRKNAGVNETEVATTSEEDLIDESQKNMGNGTNFSLFNMTRRQGGICQNDHGGPLVAWIDGKEHVIGVASVFRLNEKAECTMPNLFTSTALNNVFINCVLRHKKTLRRSICDKPASEKGFNIIRRSVSWTSQISESDESEVINMRPQIPINVYGKR